MAVGSCLTLPRLRASQASSSSTSVVTGVGGSSSDEAEVVDEPLLERDVAGLDELEASGAKTLSIAGWLCASQPAHRKARTHIAAEDEVGGLGQAAACSDRVDDPAE